MIFRRAQLPLTLLAMLIATTALVPFIVIVPACAKERSAEDEHLIEIFTKKAFKDTDKIKKRKKDRSRAFFSDELNHWVNLYVAGKTAESEKVWAKILKGIAYDRDIKWFLDRVAQRVEIDTCDTDHQIAPVKLLRDFLSQTQKAVGEYHPFTAYTYDLLSNYYEGMKDYKTCEPYRLRALEIRKKCFGPSDEKVAKSYQVLGRHYYERGDMNKAKDSLTKALAIKPDSDETQKYLKWVNSKLKPQTKAKIK